MERDMNRTRFRAGKTWTRGDEVREMRHKRAKRQRQMVKDMGETQIGET